MLVLICIAGHCTYIYCIYIFLFLTSLTGEYSGSSSSEEEDDDDISPREKVLRNSKGKTDFRVRNMKIAPYGRKEIEMAEQGILISSTDTHTHIWYICIHLRFYKF